MYPSFFFKLCTFACAESAYGIAIDATMLSLIVGIIENIVGRIFVIVAFTVTTTFYYIDTVFIP
jgi:hypothetical protein